MSQINVDIIRSRTGTAATCDKGVVVSGTCTATTFSGALTGDVTGNADTATTAATVTGATQAAINLRPGLSKIPRLNYPLQMSLSFRGSGTMNTSIMHPVFAIFSQLAQATINFHWMDSNLEISA